MTLRFSASRGLEDDCRKHFEAYDGQRRIMVTAPVEVIEMHGEEAIKEKALEKYEKLKASDIAIFKTDFP